VSRLLFRYDSREGGSPQPILLGNYERCSPNVHVFCEDVQSRNRQFHLCSFRGFQNTRRPSLGRAPGRNRLSRIPRFSANHEGVRCEKVLKGRRAKSALFVGRSSSTRCDRTHGRLSPLFEGPLVCSTFYSVWYAFWVPTCCFLFCCLLSGISVFSFLHPPFSSPLVSSVLGPLDIINRRIVLQLPYIVCVLCINTNVTTSFRPIYSVILSPSTE